MTNIIFTAVGLALLLVGGDLVVRGAMWLSKRLNLSPFFIGMVVIGFGTSLPELVVCIDAALNGLPSLAIGNVIGSNIANTLLILGVAATICPVVVKSRELSRDNLALISTTAFFTLIGFIVGQIEWYHGVIMISGLGAYILFSALSSDVVHPSGAAEIKSHSLAQTLVLFILGFASVVIGAEFLVEGAVGLSLQLGVPEEVIGLTVIAIGTSLPEIATTSMAAWRGNTQLCLGNIIGSSLFNISALAGITSLITPLPFSDRIIGFDLFFLVAVTVLISVIMIFGKQISRIFGCALTAVYFVYIIAQLTVMG